MTSAEPLVTTSPEDVRVSSGPVDGNTPSAEVTGEGTDALGVDPRTGRPHGVYAPTPMEQTDVWATAHPGSFTGGIVSRFRYRTVNGSRVGAMVTHGWLLSQSHPADTP